MKKLVVAILTWSSKRVLKMHKPTVIAVTGSVGKTSTKEAIALVLSSKFSVRTSKKNLNTEIGVPLAILGLGNPMRSVFGWLGVLKTAILAALKKDPNFPSHLVLEFGADRPGDIKHLVELTHPLVGVVTAISHVHAEQYPSFEALIEEKSELVKGIPPGGLTVLNADEEAVLSMRAKSQAPVLSYGFGPDAEVDGQNYVLETREDASFEAGETLADVRFTTHNRRTDDQADVVLKNTIGIHQAYDALAAAAVGLHFGISLTQSAEALRSYTAPPGRLKPIPGIKGCLLLDDTYNAAPSSTKAALEVLKNFHPAENARRIAVLGEMAELGSYSEEQHRQIGWRAAEAEVDLLVCVKEKARDICRGALEAGMKHEQVVEFPNPEEAGRYLDHEVKKGDIVLIKGSQSSRMEKVTKDLMFDPMRAKELLVRQEAEWLKT